MIITRDGTYYRRFLPHYRLPGGIYHCRFSLNPSDQGFRFTEDWMFAIIERSNLADHKRECMIHAYVVMADHAHGLAATSESEQPLCVVRLSCVLSA
jgi:REP element-mobilizing transposase RayT